MSRYAVRATDSFFGGLHGIEDWMIAEGNYDSAVCEGYELARETIAFYSVLEQAYDNSEEFDDEELEDAYNELAQCEVHKIREDCPLSDEEINEAMFQDYDEFVATWCEEEV